MSGFVTRTEREKEEPYTVIFTTDDHDKYLHIENECRIMIDHAKPPTNADRIRSMTDEKLADWFSIYCCRNKTYDAHCETFGNCKDCWIDWLKEEAQCTSE